MEYILENEKLKVTVNSLGAELVSVVHKDDGVEHMWCGDSAVWGRHAPILFPHTGKVRNGRFEAKGKVYTSGQHGFAREMEHTLVSVGMDELVLELRSSQQTMELWPYEFRLVSSFRIEGEILHHNLRIENPGREKLSFGVGYHPAFQIPFDDQHTYTDYEFRFHRNESPICLETAGGLVTGNTYTLGTNITAIPLDDKLFANDSHCMINLTSKTLGIYEKDTGRAVVCDIEKFPYTLIWSKPGEPKFVCIEPWYSLPCTSQGSDKWADKPAAAVLAPGQHFTAKLKMTFKR